MDRRRSVASCIAMATSQGAPDRGYQVGVTLGNRVGKAPQYTFHLEGVPSAVCGAFRRETRPWRWVAAVERHCRWSPTGAVLPPDGKPLAGVHEGGKSEVVLLPD